MSPKRGRIYLDIDPDRPVGLVLLELTICLGRRGCTWVRRHPRSAVGLVVALATWLGTPVAIQLVTRLVDVLVRHT
jgi:hypothetical protein